MTRPSSVPILLLGAAIGGAIAAIVTTVILRAEDDSASPPAATEHRTAASPTTRELVCARTDLVERSDARRDQAACDVLGVAAASCVARLDDCERGKASLRHPWPVDGPAIESADAWLEAVENALDRCEIAADIDVVECTEYPCVAALRPRAAAGPHADQAVALNQAIDGCDALKQVFGVGADQLDAVEVYPVRVPCEDGDEYAQVLMALDPRGAAFAALEKDDGGDSTNELLRWMYRRGDDVAALWPCGEGS